jgi:hypothetical protein
MLFWLRSVKADQRYVSLFMNWINSELRMHCDIEYDISVIESTARNWLIKLNFHYKYHQVSSYIDGHERADVAGHGKTSLSKWKNGRDEWNHMKEIA